jgi:ATP phosphoribosyltransferase
MTAPLTIALSKGRILEEALPLFAAAGLQPGEDPASTRRLILPSTSDDIRFVVVRATDVPTYVQYGGAELGVAGKDVLLEHGGEGLYEPLDLGIAACRLMLAGPAEGAPAPRGRPRVATKYVNTTHLHFARQGRQVEIIKLYGSMELAPLMGLADWIVDLVDTGNTLQANGLAPYEKIADISSRLVVNRAAMKTRNHETRAVIDALRTALNRHEHARATSG